MNIEYCKRCCLPNTRPHLGFDEKGICDACRSVEKKEKIDWNSRFEELKKILDRYKSKDGSWDCIVPVSGGKDSTYQLYMMKELGMHPLAVTFSQCGLTKEGLHNLNNIAELGAEHMIIRPNRQVYKKLFKLGFEKLGDPCWPCHVGMFTIPVRIAVNFNIPLIIWGENSQMEYGGPAAASDSNILNRRWLEEFGGMQGMRVEDWISEGIPKEALKIYTYPSDEELKKVGVTGLFLGYYIKWDARKQLETVKKLGFKPSPKRAEGSYLDYENVDCLFDRIHDYLMWLKYGFSRTTAQTGIDIRNKRMTREEAVKLIKKYDNEKPIEYFGEFCDFVGKSGEEVNKIFDSFTNKAIFETDNEGKLIKDKEGNPILKNPLE